VWRVRTFLVTGVSGAGKSTMARQLRAWGHYAVSADGDSELCGWTDRDGRRVQRPAQPDEAWLAAHEWQWDPQRLDEIIADAERRGMDTFWLCGRAANALQLADRFDTVFLLEIDEQTMVARMSSPQRGNDFGRVGDTLRDAVATHLPFVAEWRRFGAITVDATLNVRAVGEELLMAAAMAALRRR